MATTEEMKIQPNSILPVSGEKQLQQIKSLSSFTDRDGYSALHDAFLHNIAEQLKLLVDKETYDKVYTSSLFPERMAKVGLRLCEDYINNMVNPK